MDLARAYTFAGLVLVFIGGVLIGGSLKNNELEIEQSRIACLLAVDDDREEQACLPPSYGLDW